MFCYLLLFCIPALIDSASVLSCGDFLEGACDLSEDNIVGHDRYTDSPAKCQEKCREDSLCSWFTHFDTQCYLLAECGESAQCQGCVSGPTSPDFATCPWPPNPDSTTTSTSKSSTPTTPTTKPTTKPTTPSTTSTSTTSTTPSTSSTPLQDCNDIVKNELCDWDYALISYYDHVMVASECQNICRSVNGARYFSHFNIFDDYKDDDLKGRCGCFSSCSWPTSAHCHKSCDDFTRDASKCHCMRGPLLPDVDACL